MKAWHFVGATLRDGRPVPKDGELLIHTGRVLPCVSGLHASPTPWDALPYAPGDVLCLVELGEDVVSHGEPTDKYVSDKRTIITRMDATPLLRLFARQQALSVVHLWEPSQAVLDFLMGDDAARGAARDAAWGAARDAARGAARDAAWGAARAAARGAARDTFNSMVYEAFEDWL